MRPSRRAVTILTAALVTAGTVGVATTAGAGLPFGGFATENCPDFAEIEPTIVGTPGDDVIYGTNGDDIIFGLGGDDIIFGMKGRDILCGDAGDDVLWGGRNKDFLIGGDGNDKLRGGGGLDVLFGGLDDDRLSGGGGTDFLSTSSARTACEATPVTTSWSRPTDSGATP